MPWALRNDQIPLLAKEFLKESSSYFIFDINIAEKIKTFISNFPWSEISSLLGKEFGKANAAFTDEFLKESNGAMNRWIWEVTPSLSLAALVTTAVPSFGLYLYHQATHAIGRPQLATEIREQTYFSMWKEQLFPQLFTHESTTPIPIYNEKTSKRINRLIQNIQHTCQNGGFFQNVLFYGPGGTGKTMISEYIAENASLNYIKMSGGDLAQYIKRGEHVSELNRLMKKIQSASSFSPNTPWILFIDEAESLCRHRSLLSQELIELQNAFLSHTGKQTSRFLLMLSTNRVEDLDPAILSRIDHKILIEAPEEQERMRILELYLPRFFSQEECNTHFNTETIQTLAKKTKGLTGRDLFKIVNDLSTTKASQQNNLLSSALIDEIVSEFTDQERTLNN